MNKKPIYAALSVLAVLSSGCAYRGTTTTTRTPGPVTSRAIGNVAYNPNPAAATPPTTTYPYVSTPGTAYDGYVPGTAASGVSYYYPANTAAARFRSSVASAMGLCDRLYSSAAGKNWSACGSLKSSLSTAVSNCGLMNSNTTTLNSASQQKLSSLLTRLDSAVASKDSAAVQSCANKISKQLYDMGNTVMPDSVSRVNLVKYYSRALALSNNMTAANKCKAGLVKSWNGIRSSTANRGLQTKVNAISRHLKNGDLAGAKSACNSLYTDPRLAGNRSTMGL